MTREETLHSVKNHEPGLCLLNEMNLAALVLDLRVHKHKRGVNCVVRFLQLFRKQA